MTELTTTARALVPGVLNRHEWHVDLAKARKHRSALVW